MIRPSVISRKKNDSFVLGRNQGVDRNAPTTGVSIAGVNIQVDNIIIIFRV